MSDSSPEHGNCTANRRGFLLILSSPSGAGKTTLARRLVESDLDLCLSVSVTTRPPREGEKDGVHYHFVSLDEFSDLRDKGALLEWAEVFGKFYGTPREPVEGRLAKGRDMVFDVDWQGARSLWRILPEDCVRVFILPPSRQELERRIRSRGTDADHVIQRRLAGADEEMSHWNEYDYIVVNCDLEESVATLRGIVLAERARRNRLKGMDEFVRGLRHNPADTDPDQPPRS